MFGKNIPIKPQYKAGTGLNVVSLFATIQGEGPLAGEPAVFVRLAGCNLRCHFCDTEFTKGAHMRSYESLAREIEFLAGNSISLVVLTGGEPLAQPIEPLLAQLRKSDLYVQIETAGTVWQPGLEKYVLEDSLCVVCSPKTAIVHPSVVQVCEHYKYIIRDREVSLEDGLPEFSTQDPGRPTRLFRPTYSPDVQIWVQPCDEYDHDSEHAAHDFEKIKANIAECVRSALKHGYRVSFQVHKALGVE